MQVRFVAVFVLAFASAAHAQAPGEIAPAPVTPAQNLQGPSLHVGIGPGSYSIKESEMDAVPFGTFELAGRYRFTPQLELGLELGGGGAMKGNLKAGSLFLDGRYRLLADKPWNVILIFGLGVASVSGKSAPDNETKGRGAVRIGVGAERRFGHFGLAGTLRIIGITSNSAKVDLSPPTTERLFASQPLTGVVFAISGGYYF